jgi:hypothetical protein
MCTVVGHQIKFFYWPQRVRYTVSEILSVSPSMVITRFAPLPAERHPRMCRIVDDIVDVLVNSNPPLVMPSVRIENYAFGVANTSSLTVLAELGGAVKSALCRRRRRRRRLRRS